MALVRKKDILDSLSTLLSKVHAITIINKDNLDFIQSRKGQQVILKHQYSLKLGVKPTKRRKFSSYNQKQNTNNDHDDSEDELLKLSNHKHTKPVDDIIEAWKYRGHPLTAEKIAFDHFIDIKLKKFDDLVRLNEDYMNLYEKYARVLHDEPESVAAVYGLLKNLEKVHVAIGEVHVQVLDAKDSVQGNEIIFQRIKNLSYEYDKLKEEIPKVDIVMNDQEEDDDILEFESLASLSCKRTFKHESNVEVWDMKCISIDDRQYIACGLDDGSITVWDLTSQTISFTLTGHTNEVKALASYKKEGIQMLASGSKDKTIKLWNLSSRILVATLSGHTKRIRSLSTYINDGKVFLASASWDTTIKIWDIENNASLITTLEGHAKSVTMKTCMLDGIPYLVSGDWGGKIKIWNLNTHKSIKTLVAINKKITSLAVTNQNNKIIIACGFFHGGLEICDLENNSFTVLSSSLKDTLISLAFIRQGNQLCLIGCYYLGKLKCWNMEDRSIISTFEYVKGNSLLTCEVGGGPCIVTGGDYGQISIWSGMM